MFCILIEKALINHPPNDVLNNIENVRLGSLKLLRNFLFAAPSRHSFRTSPSLSHKVPCTAVLNPSLFSHANIGARDGW